MARLRHGVNRINSRKPSLLKSISERLCVRAQQEMESLLNSVREERAGWFSEETTGYPTQLCLSLFFFQLLKWSRNPYLTVPMAYSLYSSSLLLKCHTEVRSSGQLQFSILLLLNDGFFASHSEYCPVQSL